MSLTIAFRNSKDTDKNKDGEITLNEAFEYAKERCYWSKNCMTPQIFSEMDVSKVSIK